MSSKVSIVIPFYNHGKYIKIAIQSVLASSYTDIEVIIVNDGSNSENTVILNEITSSFSNVTVVHQENQGPCSAKNYGVECSSGDIIGFLDSDNEFQPNYIEEALNELKKDKIGWCFGDAEYYGDKEGYKDQQLKGVEEIFINSPIDNCLFIKRSIFNEVGGFDEYLNRLGLEDWELTVRLLVNNVPFVHIKKTLFKYRAVKDSRSNNEATENRDLVVKYVFSKHHNAVFSNYSNLFFELYMLRKSKWFILAKLIKRILKR